MSNCIKTKVVSRKKFEKKLKNLDPKVRLQIKNAMLRNEKEIFSFEYGRVPGERVYKIIYKDGMTRTWKTRKMI